MIVRVACIALALLCSAQATVQTRTPRSFCDEAARLYAQGRFREAAAHYEEAVGAGLASAEVRYNLGSAYYKSGDVARSILNFERARRLNPGDADIEQNLAVARARMKDRVEPIPLLFAVQWWNDLKSDHRPGTLFGVSVALAWLCAAAAFVFFGFSDIVVRRVALVAASILFAAFLASVALAVDAQEDFESRRFAIVMESEVAVSSAADASAVESFAIHAGLKVELLSRRGNRWLIRLADGKDGWVGASAVERI